MTPIQQDSGKVDGDKIPKSVTTLTSDFELLKDKDGEIDIYRRKNVREPINEDRSNVVSSSVFEKAVQYCESKADDAYSPLEAETNTQASTTIFPSSHLFHRQKGNNHTSVGEHILRTNNYSTLSAIGKRSIVKLPKNYGFKVIQGIQPVNHNTKDGSQDPSKIQKKQDVHRNKDAKGNRSFSDDAEMAEFQRSSTPIPRAETTGSYISTTESTLNTSNRSKISTQRRERHFGRKMNHILDDMYGISPRTGSRTIMKRMVQTNEVFREYFGRKMCNPNNTDMTIYHNLARMRRRYLQNNNTG